MAFLAVIILSSSLCAAPVLKEVSYGVDVYLDDRKIDAVGVIIDGVTYLPVRAVTNAFESDVAWDEIERRVNIESTFKKDYEFYMDNLSHYSNGYEYTMRSLGIKLKIAYDMLEQANVRFSNTNTKGSHSNPYLMNDVAVNTFTNRFNGASSLDQHYTLGLIMQDVIRGERAWEIINDANYYAIAADDGYEYVLVKFWAIVAFTNPSRGYAVNLKNVFKFYSEATGEEYPPRPYIQQTQDFPAFPLLGETGQFEGWVVGQVKKGEVFSVSVLDTSEWNSNAELEIWFLP